MSIKHKILILVLILIATQVHAQLIPNLGGQRTGTSSLQFLKIGADARATGMGEAFIAVSDDFSALQYNPAGLVLNKDNGLSFTHTAWFADSRIEHLGGVYHFGGNNAVGLSVTSFRTEDMKVTTEFQPNGTGNYFRFSDLAVGLSYARQFTDQFSFGITVKYVEETMGELKMRTVLGDLATFYKTGLGTTRFAVVIANFGAQVSPSGSVDLIGGRTASEFQKFPPPTLFKIGFAFEPWMNQNNRVTTSIQLNSPNDNKEFINVGAEYSYKEMVTIRGGYKFNVDAENFSVGAGVKVPISFAKVGVNYSLANFGDWGYMHRFSVNLILPEKNK